MNRTTTLTWLLVATTGCESGSGFHPGFRDVEPCAGEIVEVRSEVASDDEGPVYESIDEDLAFDNAGEAGSLVLDTADGVLEFSWQGLAVEGEIQRHVSGELRLDDSEAACLALSEGELLFDDQECRRGRFLFDVATTAGGCGISSASLDEGVHGCFRAPVPVTSDCGD